MARLSFHYLQVVLSGGVCKPSGFISYGYLGGKIRTQKNKDCGSALWIRKPSLVFVFNLFKINS